MSETDPRDASQSLWLETLAKVLNRLGRSKDNPVAILESLPEQVLWDFIREILLILRSRIATPDNESSLKRALGYLYTLTRAVESLGRYPTIEEQGVLLESSLFPNLEGWKPLSELLKELGDRQDSRRALKKLRERRRRYR